MGLAILQFQRNKRCQDHRGYVKKDEMGLARFELATSRLSVERYNLAKPQAHENSSLRASILLFFIKKALILHAYPD